MMRFTIAGVAALFLTLSGSPAARQAAAQAIPDDFSITLARTTCFGECPAYAVTIYAKGNVTYEGKKFVRVEGRRSTSISVEAVAALLATVTRIRFFDLEDQYRVIRTADGSAIDVTDLPTTFVMVTQDGRSKQVLDYFGAPASLRQLEQQIDRTARTKQWISLDEATFRQMLSEGWSPSVDERAELLRKALQDDDAGVIKALLANGADPNRQYYGTTTPLMMAQSAAAARVLLEAGANPLTRTARGVTALMYAVHFAPDLAETLLQAGAPPDDVDLYGTTPLYKAACAGNAGVVKLLLTRGADPTRHPDSESALECARSGRDYERLYPQKLLNPNPPFVKEFDSVIALLERALATRRRK
jgi:hypothetical protein